MDDSKTEKSLEKISDKDVVNVDVSNKDAISNSIVFSKEISESVDDQSEQVFLGKAFGCIEVLESRGNKVCETALALLRARIIASRQHKRRIECRISMTKIIINESGLLEDFHVHDLKKITFVWRDPNDVYSFGLITSASSSCAEKKIWKFYGYKMERKAKKVIDKLKEVFKKLKLINPDVLEADVSAEIESKNESSEKVEEKKNGEQKEENADTLLTLVDEPSTKPNQSNDIINPISGTEINVMPNDSGNVDLLSCSPDVFGFDVTSANKSDKPAEKPLIAPPPSVQNLPSTKVEHLFSLLNEDPFLVNDKLFAPVVSSTSQPVIQSSVPTISSNSGQTISAPLTPNTMPTVAPYYLHSPATLGGFGNPSVPNPFSNTNRLPSPMLPNIPSSSGSSMIMPSIVANNVFNQRSMVMENRPSNAPIQPNTLSNPFRDTSANVSQVVWPKSLDTGSAQPSYMDNTMKRLSKDAFSEYLNFTKSEPPKPATLSDLQRINIPMQGETAKSGTAAQQNVFGTTQNGADIASGDLLDALFS